MRILLAEDNPVNQKVVSIMLQQRKHDVTVVDDGRKAVEACRETRFDLVFMDIQMPEMDGFLKHFPRSGSGTRRSKRIR